MASTDALRPLRDFELGYWLSAEEHPPRALVGFAGAAEAAGFTLAGISDHAAPWVPQQHHSAYVWSVLGGIATTTTQLRVGTGVTAPIHRQHPFTIAHAAATVEAMMPGRFFLGLGTGELLNEHFFGDPWPPPARRRAMVQEAIEIIRSLWQGKRVSHRGEHFTLERAQLFSRPAATPPLVVAASGREMARVAGRCGDALFGVDADPDLVDSFLAATDGVGTKPRIAQLHLCWASSDAAAISTIRSWWPHAAVPPSILHELALPAQFAAVAAHATDEDLRRSMPCGPDPEPVVSAIRRFTAAGYSAVLLHQVGPDQAGFLEFSRRHLLEAFA
jgi:coenzyme F420-dependent glucose-6-phosphate dehydrogenase